MEDLLNRTGVKRLTFYRGDYIIKQGELVEAIYYLETGRCYRGAQTEGGNEVFFDFKMAFGSFYDALVGVLAMFSSDQKSECNFIATELTCAYRIPVDIAMNYFSEDPVMLKQLLAISIDKQRQISWLFAARQEGRVPNQLCKLLYFNSYLAEDGRRRVHPDYSSFIRLSQKLGVHKVTISKMIRALREEGIIVTEGRRVYIVDADKMLAYIMNERQLSY